MTTRSSGTSNARHSQSPEWRAALESLRASTAELLQHNPPDKETLSRQLQKLESLIGPPQGQHNPYRKLPKLSELPPQTQAAYARVLERHNRRKQQNQSPNQQPPSNEKQSNALTDLLTQAKASAQEMLQYETDPILRQMLERQANGFKQNPQQTNTESRRGTLSPERMQLLKEFRKSVAERAHAQNPQTPSKPE